MTTRLTPPVSDRDHVLGPADATVTLIEFGDYECPYCGMAYPIVKSILGQTGDSVRFAYRHFPLTKIHPHAELAAQMAEAAADRGKFWPMHELLFQNQQALEFEDLLGYAARVGIDPSWAGSAVLSGRYAERIREDVMSGARSGVNGTPTFFINGLRHDAPWDEPTLLEALQEAALAAPR
jgi:protein-disulfide isomerase